jgi:hypothetical protein
MTTKQVSFDVSAEDGKIIAAIVVRAASKMNIGSKLDLVMDLTACHANGCPLKLRELLEADDFNFAHDIRGIQSHLNRRTGELTDCFCPRFAC